MKGRNFISYLLLSVIIFVLFYMVYYKSKNNELENLRLERMKIEQDVQKSRVKKRELDKIETELKTMNVTLKDLEAIIPQRKEIYSILRRIQSFAQESQLNIRKFAPQPVIAREFFSEQPILIEMTGSYHKLGIFFDRLNSFSRIFIIEVFSITTLPRQAVGSTISATCTAKTFFFHEKPEGKKQETKNKRKK